MWVDAPESAIHIAFLALVDLLIVIKTASMPLSFCFFLVLFSLFSGHLLWKCPSFPHLKHLMSLVSLFGLLSLGVFLFLFVRLWHLLALWPILPQLLHFPLYRQNAAKAWSFLVHSADIRSSQAYLRFNSFHRSWTVRGFDVLPNHSLSFDTWTSYLGGRLFKIWTKNCHPK